MHQPITLAPSTPEPPPAGDPNSTIRQRVVSATISNYAGRLLGLGAWFILTPFLLLRLGPTEYGLWVLIGSLVAYGWLLNAGVQGAITRYVSACRARDDFDLASRIVSTSLCWDVLLGLMAIALSAALAPFIPVLFQIPPDDRATASWLVLLMGIGIGVTLPCETGGAVLRGLHRYDLASLVNVVGTLLNVGAVVWVLLAGGGLLAVVAVGVPAAVISQLLSMWLCRRVAPALRFSRRDVDPSLVRTILGFSWPLLLGQTATLLQRRSDEIVIAIFLPVSLVTPYALAHRLSDVCRELTKQFMGPFLPLASELDARQDTTRLRALYLSGTRLALAIFLPLACTVTVLAHPLLRLWVGAAYADNVGIVAILSIAGALISTEWLATAVLQGMARHRLQGVAAVCCALGNVAVSAALVGPLGLTGVALGTLIAAVVESSIVMPYAARVIGVTASDWMKRILLPTLLPAAAMTAFLYVVEINAEPESIPALIGTAALGVAIFAVSYLTIGASRSERQLCKGLAIGTLRLARSYTRRL
jgi:O-antigen/teichoic acid export membrane protein